VIVGGDAVVSAVAIEEVLVVCESDCAVRLTIEPCGVCLDWLNNRNHIGC